MVQVTPVLGIPKFLLVDDQQENLSTLAKTLHSLPVELVMANSGQEAIAVMVTTEFALIIINQEMAELDGLTTAKIIRSFPLGVSPPILFLTVQATAAEIITDVDSMGIIDYLTKPINPSFLHSKAKFYLHFFNQKQTLEYQNIHLESLTKVEDIREGLDFSEQISQVILSSISDAIFIANAKGEFTFVSPNINIIFGYTFEEVKAMGNIYQLLGNFTFNQYQLREEGKLLNLFHDIKDKHGKIHHLLINIKKVAMNGGVYLYNCRDISEWVQSEQAIRNSEANFRDIFATISDGLLILDEEKYICYANATALQLLNSSLEGLVGSIWIQEQYIELDLIQEDGSICTVDINLTAIEWYGQPAELVSLRDISDRKRMEEELRENRNKYYRLLENLDSGVIVHDAHTNIVYANPKAKDFLGGENLEGRNVEDKHWIFFDKDGNKLPIEDFPISQVLDTQAPLTDFEMGIYRKGTEEVLWAYVNAYPEFYNQENIQDVVVTFSDITKRKQAEIQLKSINENLEILVEERTSELEAANAQLLQEIIEKEQVSLILGTQEAKYRALVRNASDAIILIDKKLVILEINHRAVELTGYAQEEFIGRSIWNLQLLPPEFKQEQRHFWRRLKNDQIAELTDVKLIRKSGKMISVDISGSVITYENESVIQFIVHDVTEQKQQLQIIQDNEATLRCIVENLPIFFGMRTMNFSKWYYINPSFETLTGHTPQEMYDDPLLWQKFHQGEDAENLEQPIFNLGEWAIFSMKKKNGQQIWVQTIEFLVDDLSESARVVVFGQDITDIKRAEIEVRRALVKERDLNEAKSQFVDIVSHEFRTPLTSIIGFGELLSKYFDRLSSEKKLHYVSNIQRSSQRLKQLIDDVLSISRYDANKLEVNLANTNLQNLGNDLIEELSCGLGSEHNLEFNYHLAANEICVLDVNLLRHALENLLSNAIKYSPKASTVTLDINKDNQYLIFRVQDEGIGIPTQDHEKLFEAFHRASNVGDIPGTGLGLSIVKRYVEFQRGTIEVESAEGRGTVMLIKLPILHSPFLMG